MNPAERHNVEKALEELKEMKAGRKRDYILFHNSPGPVFAAIANMLGDDARTIGNVISRLESALACNGKEKTR